MTSRVNKSGRIAAGELEEAVMEAIAAEQEQAWDGQD
jgi:hypothetical protein